MKANKGFVILAAMLSLSAAAQNVSKPVVLISDGGLNITSVMEGTDTFHWASGWSKHTEHVYKNKYCQQVTITLDPNASPDYYIVLDRNLGGMIAIAQAIVQNRQKKFYILSESWNCSRYD